MPDLNKIYLFRMTHIENILHILKHGITHATSELANENFRPIGDGSLIATRNNYLLDNGRQLGEYIPFYFGARTPMLYVIQNGFNMVAPTPAEQIVYCVTSVKKIIEHELDFVFTDGHAVDGFSTQYSSTDIHNIDDILDKEAINAKYWIDENDLDRKRRKEAEFLILGDISINAILGFLVYNENAKNKIIEFGTDSEKVHIRSDFYF
ncbi:type II toxin-antitoxin system toxin DNA ADP-ribosyl transferase DarT [Pedobacter sp. GSP4]|uniref:type II toxin-antitoxin system toxin DNA ADP-ribosyl transferase DarT n=1 Tax=Pedobacter sp. GSP4 TaxID=3453716 RepID=UPI003EEB7E09